MNNEPAATTLHGTLRRYLTGFFLSIVLTAVPFALVMSSALRGTAALITVTLFAAVQVTVQLVLFLHLGRSREQRWNLTIFLYTLTILALLVGASIWVLYRLDLYHMAP